MKETIFNRKRQKRIQRTIEHDPLDAAPSISDELQNRQVTEIEGYATHVDIRADSARNQNDHVGSAEIEQHDSFNASSATSFNADYINDFNPTTAAWEQSNEHLVVSLAQPNVAIQVGETAVFDATILNNGPIPATFGLRIDGWIDNSWLNIFPAHVRLNPGTRETITLHITPPQHYTSRAGTHHLDIIALSPEYPRQRNQLNATLTIHPYESFTIEPLHSRALSTSWYNRSTRLIVPLTNNGNQQIALDLEGRDAEQACTFEFLTPDVVFAQFGQGVVKLHPGQTVSVPIRVTPREQSFFRLQKQLYPFYISARIRTQEPEPEATVHKAAYGASGYRVGALGQEPSSARSITGTITNFPLVGPWHLLSFVGFGLTTLVGVGLAMLVILLLMLQPNESQSVSATLAASQLPPAAPPVVIIQPSGQGSDKPSALSEAEADQIAQELNFGVSVPNTEPNRTNSGTFAQPDSAQSGSTQPGSTQPGSTQPNPAQPDSTLTVQGYFPNITGSSATGGDGTIQTGNGSGLPVIQPQQVTSPDQTVAASPATAPSAPSETVLTYEQMFQMVGGQYGLDWRLLAAVAYVESGFDPAAVSNQQDMGLMQIRLATWNEWAPSVGASDPFDAYSNVMVSAAYLNFLHNLFGQQGYPQEMWMLAAYNWGPDKLGTFINNGRGWEEMPRTIQKYVSDILWIASNLPKE